MSLFKTDAEYLLHKKQFYLNKGLRVSDESKLLKEKYRLLKTFMFVSVVVGIIYAFILGLAFAH